MKLIGLCFTQKGARVLKEIRENLEERDFDCYCGEKLAEGANMGFSPLSGSLSEFVGAHFKETDGFVFVGATGIAVRSIAPYLESKTSDPAVVVADELGNYVISLLSGHLGGANELTVRIADAVRGTAVITTATDLNHKFAVDVFAKNNGMKIMDMRLAKEISAKVLNGQKIGCYSDFPFRGTYPDCFGEEEQGLMETGIYIGLRSDKKPFKRTLRLIPEILTLGIGCKKDTPADVIEARIAEVLAQEHIEKDAIEQIVSIDLKREEKGLIEVCDRMEIPFHTFSKEELVTVRGIFQDSPFVEEVTGVGNICERAAVYATDGTIIHKKDAGEGVTIAVAMKDWSVYFE